MQIRAHHILCIGNYVGRGYSKEFTANMDDISKRLKNGEQFTLTKGKDDVCSACPYLIDGECKTKEKSDRYDINVINALGLEYGKQYEYENVNRLAAERIYKKGAFDEICGDCEWHGLCAQIK